MGFFAPEGSPHIPALAGLSSESRFRKPLTLTDLPAHRKCAAALMSTSKTRFPPFAFRLFRDVSGLMDAAVCISRICFGLSYTVFSKKAPSLFPFISRLCKAGRDQKLVGATRSPNCGVRGYLYRVVGPRSQQKLASPGLEQVEPG